MDREGVIEWIEYVSVDGEGALVVYRGGVCLFEACERECIDGVTIDPCSRGDRG